MTESYNVVIFGAPGSGKGTQSQIMRDRWGFEIISTGEVFRRAIREETELGLEVKDLIAQGHLVPDVVTNALVRDCVLASPPPSDALFIPWDNVTPLAEPLPGLRVFDGYPRTVAQAQALDALLASLGQKVDIVLNLEVEERVLLARVLARAETQHRPEDNSEAFRARMADYHEKTRPVLAHYSTPRVDHSDGIVWPIDADDTLGMVTARISMAASAAPPW